MDVIVIGGGAGLTMGDVVRVTLLLRDRFWAGDVLESATSSLERLAFLHAPRWPFNIGWTQYPLRALVVRVLS